MNECPICAAAVEISEGVVENELITCLDCGTELEVTSVNPVTLAEAPQEEEDWGQ